MPKRSESKTEIPSTLERSPAKAQRTWRKTHDNAVERYGEGERAHRTAYASLKRTFKKADGRWVPKGHSGPSDPRSAQRSTQAKRAGKGETFGGVDYYGSSKKELYEQAQNMNIPGRSRMNKKELARAVARKQ